MVVHLCVKFEISSIILTGFRRGGGGGGGGKLVYNREWVELQGMSIIL